MADLTPTFHFENGEWFAFHEGAVIVSGKDIDKVEKTALEYLEAQSVEADKKGKENSKKSATHIITPNGIKGEIMGTTPSLWGDTVTVRLANGSFAHYQTRGDEQYVIERTASSTGNPVESLEARLSADYDHGKSGLIERLHELRDIESEATRLASAGAPYTVAQQLHTVRVSASAESKEIKTALDYLESVDAEAFIPTAPFRASAVEQAELGHRSNDWLEVVAQGMVDEAKDTDFDKLLIEGPEVFVAELEPATLADAGVVREIAVSHIHGRTAGFEGSEVADYRDQFVARVEAARRRALASHTANVKKEAAVEHEAHSDAPDEALFM